MNLGISMQTTLLMNIHKSINVQDSNSACEGCHCSSGEKCSLWFLHYPCHLANFTFRILLFLHQNNHPRSDTPHPAASCSTDIRVKCTCWLWSQPFTSIHCQGWECIQLHIHSHEHLHKLVLKFSKEMSSPTYNILWIDQRCYQNLYSP